jgi:hypothetical protein
MSPKNRGRGWQVWLASFASIAAIVVCAGFALTSPRVGLADPPPAGRDASDASAPPNGDFDRQSVEEFYRQNIEPIFTRPRGYPGESDGNAACVMCHVWQTSLRFALDEMTDSPDGWTWTEEQSRRNYDVVTQLVNASDPPSSLLLLKPLSTQAGGLAHTGGNYWESTEDPEYQVVLEWIRLLPPAQFTPPPAPTVDFEFYRSCVLPIFQSPLYGQLSCTECHGGGSAGFAPAPASGSALTEAQARQGFQAIQRLILPGDPERSRFLLKPLHPDGGGSYAHNGVRRWQSRSDPEWQTLAAWIRGEVTGSDCSPVY